MDTEYEKFSDALKGLEGAGLGHLASAIRNHIDAREAELSVLRDIARVRAGLLDTLVAELRIAGCHVVVSGDPISVANTRAEQAERELDALRTLFRDALVEEILAYPDDKEVDAPDFADAVMARIDALTGTSAND